MISKKRGYKFFVVKGRLPKKMLFPKRIYLGVCKICLRLSLFSVALLIALLITHGT